MLRRSRRGAVRMKLGLLQKILLQELDRRVELKILVRLFAVAVAFVLGD